MLRHLLLYAALVLLVQHVDAVEFIDIDQTLSNVTLGVPLTIQWTNQVGGVKLTLTFANATNTSAPDDYNTQTIDPITDAAHDELGSSYTWIPTSGHDPDPRSFSIEMRDEDPSSNVFSPRFLMKSNGTSSTRPSTSPSSLPAPHPFDSSNDDGGYPTSAKVGIGVGVTVGLLLVAAIFAFVWWCGKRKRRMRREGMRGMRLVEMERGRKVEVSGLRAGSRSDLNIPRGNSANCYS